jgi:hypothetical protein
MKKIFEVLKKNWKTTLGGILIFVVLTLHQADYISAEVLASVTAILTALGFVVAKDGNKTGV